MADASVASAYLTLIPRLQENAASEINAQTSRLNITKGGEAAGHSFGKGFVAKAGTAIAALGLGKTMVDTVKQSFGNYADYQQLVGGMETLFGESSDKMMEYARNAFQTAGLSANEYMETATSFSASLLSSLGGDTDKAAEQANKAITQMSDNANKMGTSMESLQNAYRGFARGNFTMLDNLALGYAGTKEGMEKLLADAEELSGIHYDIESYSDMIDAIGVIQDKMGITGTTAAEAADTLSGSIGMMRGAWQNLLTGLADPNADIGALMADMMESAQTVLKNAMPAVGRILETLVDYLPDFIKAILGFITDHLPEIVAGGVELFAGLAVSAVEAIPDIIDALPKVMDAIAEKVTSEDFKQRMKNAGRRLIETLKTAIDDFRKNTLPGVLEDLKKAIKDFFANAGTWLLDAGKKLIQGLIDGAKDFLSGGAENYAYYSMGAANTAAYQAAQASNNPTVAGGSWQSMTGANRGGNTYNITVGNVDATNNAQAQQAALDLFSYLNTVGGGW